MPRKVVGAALLLGGLLGMLGLGAALLFAGGAVEPFWAFLAVAATIIGAGLRRAEAGADDTVPWPAGGGVPDGRGGGDGGGPGCGADGGCGDGGGGGSGGDGGGH